MRRVKKIGLACVLVLLATVCFGCAARVQHFSDQSMELGFVRRVALLPLENHTSDDFADERIGDVLATALLSQGAYDVVEKGDLKRFLKEEVPGSDVTALDAATGQRLAKELEVEAYVAGSVDDYSIVRNGPYSYPVIALSLRLIDAKTGRILWQASGSASGYSTWERIFGFASDDIHQIGAKLVGKLLKTLP